ncbi:PKD domain-containing protein [Spongiibacter sp. KMU-158]|uniref:PKD domain-containing protein n=1 Tax=Spongiibacter pelagi TaxID=2760804 RepID=A0A927C0V1_9GAMM|nr:PKD domain-containing protein [Spongiibacter pelagi]MBD2857591.1 PKD domain-containing protein [Spongiibacter pelagi]
MSSRILHSVFLCLPLLLSACGGSGDSSVSETELPDDRETGIRMLGEFEVASGSRQSLRGYPAPTDGSVIWTWEISPDYLQLLDIEISGNRLSYTAPPVSQAETAIVNLSADATSGENLGDARRRISVLPADFPTSIPLVDAGEDRSWPENSQQQLYATTSAKAGRTIRKLKWEQVSGIPAIDGAADQNGLSLKLPQVEAPTELVFTVSAEDSGGFVASDTVSVTILNTLANQLPAVTAGSDKQVLSRRVVELSALASDADGSIVSYQWRVLPPFSDVLINNADTATANFKAPNVAQVQNLIVEIKVVDDQGAEARDQLTVTVQPSVNSEPEILSVSADPGVVYDAESVAFSAQGTDADGDTLTYLWQQRDNGAPAAGIQNANTADAGVVIPQVTEATDFEFELVLDDGAAQDNRSVIVRAVPREVLNPSPEVCVTEPLQKGCPLYPLSSLFDTSYYESCATSPLSSDCLLGDLLGDSIVDCLTSPGENCVSVLSALADPSYLLEQIGPEEPADHCTPAFDSSTFEHYRGSLHEHTAYSDGTLLTRPEDVYEQVKEREFDFVGVTDHSDTLNIPLTVGDGECPPEQLLYCYLLIGEGYETEAFTKWVSTLEQAEGATVPNSFTGIRGFEWTSDRFGHANIFFSRNFVNAKTGPGYAVSMALFWEWFTQPAMLGGGSDGLLSFNHPGREDAVEGVLQNLGLGDPAYTFNDFRYIDSADYRVVGLEVFGKGSEYDSGGPNGSWFAYALDKGWHLSPIGSEDHHGTDWGGGSLPKTVFVARSVALDDLREAMLARRTYAVAQEYNHVKLEYVVDGEPMGARLRRPQGDSLPVRVSVNPNRALEGAMRIQLVGAGNEVLLESTGNTLLGNLPVKAVKYYAFVRVYDGARPIAFAAPVWIMPGETPLPYCQPPEIWDGNSPLYPSLGF